jgi:hypothetical protein
MAGFLSCPVFPEPQKAVAVAARARLRAGSLGCVDRCGKWCIHVFWFCRSADSPVDVKYVRKWAKKAWVTRLLWSTWSGMAYRSWPRKVVPCGISGESRYSVIF